MSTTSDILIHHEAGVCTLTFHRVDKKNAFTQAMYSQLAQALTDAAADAATRVVLLQGDATVFSAGNDIGDFLNHPPRNEEAPVFRFLRALASFPKPLVAAVCGPAVGIGTTMLLHCDLVYVAENALLTTPFVNLALVPEDASSITLPSRIGHARAFAMFVLGEAVDAKKAVDWGIANDVVPLDQLRARARATAEAVAARPPAAVVITKALMRDETGLAQRMDEEGAHFAAQLKSAEAKEAFAAFAEKRVPDFSKVS